MDQSSAGLVRLSAARHGPQPAPAPVASEDAVAGVMALIELIGDVGASKKRLVELQDAQKAAAAKIEEAGKADQRLAALDAELAARRTAHEAQLSDEKTAQQAEWSRRHQELVGKEREADQKLAAADRKLKEAQDLRDAWDSKTRALKAALGSAA
jgi:hypothetical protein